MKKKKFSILLCIIMLLSLIPISAMAAEQPQEEQGETVTEYGLWVNGEQFTSDKLSIECGEGTAVYNPETATLTLNDATIVNAFSLYGIHSAGILAEDAITIEVIGNNTITVPDDTSIWYTYGVYSYNDITMTGNGRLTVNVGSADISGYGIYSSYKLTLKDLTVNIDVCDRGLKGSDGIVIDGATITIRANEMALKGDNVTYAPNINSYIIMTAHNKGGKGAKEWNGTTELKRYKFIRIMPKTPITEYTIIEGADGTWTKGSKIDLYFKSDAPSEKFITVKVDGREIHSIKYRKEEGSTTIGLKASYLRTLAVGKHTFTIVCSDGSASTNFEIKAVLNPIIKH